MVVEKGRWEVCEGIGFQGRCAALSPGSYDRLSTMGLNDRLSSVRPANASAEYASEPPPMRRPNYDYRQRPSERLANRRAPEPGPEWHCDISRRCEV